MGRKIVGQTGASVEMTLRRIADENLKSCVPLYWHDGALGWPKEVRGASAFALRLPQRVVGVTAAHVVQQYRQARCETSTLVCQLGVLPFDLERAIIDIDEKADIATFALSDQELTFLRVIPLDGLTDAALSVEEDDLIFLLGYPELTRKIKPDLTGSIEAYGAFEIVRSVTDREILVVFQPEYANPVAGMGAVPTLKLNLSGCSGGPAIHYGKPGRTTPGVPVGLLANAPKDDAGEGAVQAFDMIRIRRINCIRSDGSIERAIEGWLP
jgi:hypothetical protein